MIYMQIEDENYKSWKQLTWCQIYLVQDFVLFYRNKFCLLNCQNVVAEAAALRKARALQKIQPGEGNDDDDDGETFDKNII